MKNSHNVKVYNNGHGDRIAFDFQGTRQVLTIEQAKALKESLEYGLVAKLDNEDQQKCTCHPHDLVYYGCRCR